VAFVGKPLFSRRPAACALVCKIDSGATVIACRNPHETDRYSPSLVTAKFPDDGAGVNLTPFSCRSGFLKGSRTAQGAAIFSALRGHTRNLGST
jgi:hypothetical protein